ncbi:MAG: rRNA maturation RNase YbeY [Pseudomonadales bacterium]
MNIMSLMTQAMPDRRSLGAPVLLSTQSNVVANLHRIDIQWGVERTTAMPVDQTISAWVRQILAILNEAPAEITIRIVSEEEITELNGRFRDKPRPTNVLSFPVGVEDEEAITILGDVVLCAGVVIAEAAEQNKALEMHFAHMVVHGVLHLKGYDHVQDNQAEQMELLERNIMGHLGYPDPYQEDN